MWLDLNKQGFGFDPEQKKELKHQELFPFYLVIIQN